MNSSSLSVELSEKTDGWDLISTPPLSGAENMAFDRATLRLIQQGSHPPVMRFFRFKHPTVTYGRHQSWEKLQALIPTGWDSVQRPTGGGIVFHEQDLCVSLCWRIGQSPLPDKPRDQYFWIHRVIRSAIQPLVPAQLATCRNVTPNPTPFALRCCFSEPVDYDLLHQGQKIVGGALCRQNGATLYQGSLQGLPSTSLEPLLSACFQQALSPHP